MYSLSLMRLRWRQEKRRDIDLGMGNPDLPTPNHIVDKLSRLQESEESQVFGIKGITQLRVAITEWYKRRFDVDMTLRQRP